MGYNSESCILTFQTLWQVLFDRLLTILAQSIATDTDTLIHWYFATINTSRESIGNGDPQLKLY